MHYDLNSIDWSRIESSRRFITGLYSDPRPKRPGIIFHYQHAMPLAPSRDWSEMDRSVFEACESLRQRPLGADDFVPAVFTGSGTSALASAFGCIEVKRGDVLWPQPVITEITQIDQLKKPKVTEGRLGGVLEQTRGYDRYLDRRIDIRIMDFQSPFTTVEQLLGSDLFFLMPYDEPARLHALMEIVADFSIDFFKAQMEAAGSRCCPGSWPHFWFPKVCGNPDV